MIKEEIDNHLSDLLHIEIKDGVFKLSKYVYICPSMIAMYNELDKNVIINALNKSDKLIITSIIQIGTSIYIYFMDISDLSNITI